MTIETITVGDFEAVAHNHFTTEGTAVLKLQPMEGLKFPCRWKHYHYHKSPNSKRRSKCNGVAVLQGLTRKNGFRISGRCTDGTVRVWRYE
jgi:hypothetical protein